MTAVPYVDVLVVGAGLSGIGAACHLKRECPERSVLIVEARHDLGGTWDLFRYPGVRSDSDMHTLGYSFRPWPDPQAIADGPSILEYIRETAEEYGLLDSVRFGHRVVAASWDSGRAQWTVELLHGTETIRVTCGFLHVCSGYYDYAAGHTPDFAGIEDFTGTVVHPQQWPRDLDLDGKRVVVIGSGADVVVTATGLNLLPLGGIRLSVDETPVDVASAIAYRAMMLCGVPNFAWTVGYTNASWTLKADLVAHYLCRLLNHMATRGYSAATPLPPAEPETAPLMDLASGYIRRGINGFPKQGTRQPWRLHQNYVIDHRVLRRAPLEDHMRFTTRSLRGSENGQSGSTPGNFRRQPSRA